MTNSATLGHQLAEAASQFIGVKFQLYGRDPRVGIDCIGLLACSLDAIGCHPVVPQGYRLRNANHVRWIDCAKQSGLVPVQDQIAKGDVLLVKPGPGQQHLLIVDGTTSVIHAHAGLRKVVRQAIDLSDKKLAHWRLS